jgi:hypothetical protein
MLKLSFALAAAPIMLAMSASAAVIIVGGPDKLTVVEHATSDATASIGKAKDNRGDILTFANPVFDAADKKQVGSDNGFCIRTVAGAAYECIWTLLVKDGQITVEGPFHDSGDTTLAVTGGTGKYIGVKGQMVLHARDAKGSAYDFRYTFVR